MTGIFFVRIKAYAKLLTVLNIVKTVYFNFKVFPWHIASKLPVFFFGPVKFASLKGKIIFDTEVIRSGMVQFGCNEENIIATNEPSRLMIEGELVFKGHSKFGYAIQISVCNDGILSFGDNSWVGTFSKIVAFRSITVGNNFLGSWECQVFDTDFHFIENISDGTIRDNNAPVIIGNNVWLGSRVTVLKNTFIPDDCIIASGSICNKDYSLTCPPKSVIGGIPAKLIKEGVKYMNDKDLELRIFKHFAKTENFGGVITKGQIKN